MWYIRSSSANIGVFKFNSKTLLFPITIQHHQFWSHLNILNMTYFASISVLDFLNHEKITPLIYLPILKLIKINDRYCMGEAYHNLYGHIFSNYEICFLCHCYLSLSNSPIGTTDGVRLTIPGIEKRYHIKETIFRLWLREYRRQVHFSSVTCYHLYLKTYSIDDFYSSEWHDHHPQIVFNTLWSQFVF